jgi:hypothetical protein
LLRKATHKGVLEIGEVEIPCFVLDDGTRVISGRGMTKAIGMKGRGQGVMRIAAHRSLSPYITPDLAEALANPIMFTGHSPKGEPTSGYEATILLQICESILQARDDDKLRTIQEVRYAIACDALVRAFAKLGIIALVDEVTGYQDQREKNALHRLLEAYIAKELLPWAKRFPDEFYKELFRLRGWPYKPSSIKRPGYVGKLTNQLVYEKLPPGVLDELKRKNPVNVATKRRKYKHHQLLSEDIGNPHLEKHLHAVITLMRASPNWDTFSRMFARAFPTPDSFTQLEFDLEDDDDAI